MPARSPETLHPRLQQRKEEKSGKVENQKLWKPECQAAAKRIFSVGFGVRVCV